MRIFDDIYASVSTWKHILLSNIYINICVYIYILTLNWYCCCSEADQKKNPRAVVQALKFYAASLKKKEEYEQKFLVQQDAISQSDDELLEGKYPVYGFCCPQKMGNRSLWIIWTRDHKEKYNF